MSAIWAVGEALIDLIPDSSGVLQPVVGGGPANTAKALAGLDLESFFIGGISTDSYGKLIGQELSEAGVDLSLAHKSELPTATATVSLDGKGRARYEFKLDGTATFDFTADWLPKGRPMVVHVGTLVTIVEPGVVALFQWLEKLGVPIVFDPNVRSSVLGDVARYRALVEKWVSISSVVKVSDEDIAWLYPDKNYLEIAKEWIGKGVALVVVTRGADGLVGITAQSICNVDGVKVNVVDTVGAGDTVGAIVVEAIVEHGLEALESERLTLVLERAAKAAAITCTRAGAKPPRREEL